MKTITDMPLYTSHQRPLERMITELSPFMTPDEVDKTVDVLHLLENSTVDNNPSPTDCKTRLELLLGRDRFNELCKQWGEKNQKFLSVFGQLKYRHKATGKLYDGLDETDSPDDYEKVYI